MTTYHHGDLRAAVLSAAAKMLEKDGAAGLSMREAARRAGVSHNAPYRHFADRRALFEALALEGLERLTESLSERGGRDLAEAYVSFALAHPERFRLMFSASQPVASAALQERFVAAFGHLGADAAAAGAAAWSLVHGLACLMLEGRLPQDPAFARRVLGAMRFASAQRSA